jgi:hypothetical protein
MAAKKNAKKSDKTLEQFKSELKSGHYNSVVGARRGVAYIPEKDREAGLKAVASHFGIGLNEPGEATRGERSGAKKKVAKKAPAKKVVKKAAASPVPAKGAKKKVAAKRKKAAPATEAPPAEAAAPTEAAPVTPAAPKKQRTRKSVHGSAPATNFASGSGPLTDLGIVMQVCGTVDQALKTIQLAQQVSKGELNIQEGLREIVETSAAAVASLRKHLPTGLTTEQLQPGGPPPEAATPSSIPPAPYGNGERPTDMGALTQAANAAGFPTAHA